MRNSVPRLSGFCFLFVIPIALIPIPAPLSHTLFTFAIDEQCVGRLGDETVLVRKFGLIMLGDAGDVFTIRRIYRSHRLHILSKNDAFGLSGLLLPQNILLWKERVKLTANDI